MLQVDSGPQFPSGRVVITANAAKQLSHEDVASALRRTSGDLDAPDRRENEPRLLAGCRLLSAHRSSRGLPFWIITETDRSCTVLLPEDF